MFARYRYSTPIGIAYFIPIQTTGREDNTIFATTNVSFPIDQVNIHDIDASVVQMTVKKHVNGFGVNQFQITLVDKQDRKGRTWLDRIYPHDLVVIRMGRPGESGLKTMMVGIVKSVTKTTSLSGSPESPQVERQVVVTGTEITSISSTHYLFGETSLTPAIRELINQFTGEFHRKIKTLYTVIHEDLVENSFGEVHELIGKYVNSILLNDFRMVRVPFTGKTLADYIRFTGNSFRIRPDQKLIIYGLYYSQFSGSGAQFIDQALQKPFNEIITRYSSDDTSLTLLDVPTCHMILRPSPFVYDVNLPSLTSGHELRNVGMVDRTKVTVHTISDLDVIAENITRGSEFSHNFFIVGPNVPEALGVLIEFNLVPVTDFEHIKKYGFNPILMKFDYLVTKETIEALNKVPENKEEVVIRTDRILATDLANVLKQWYIRSCEFLSGTLQIRGNANINEGDAILYAPQDFGNGERKFLFYVDGVSHLFVNFETYVTYLELSRGVEVS
ncbi:hypothetical protein [Candidatus Caldatribacterium sp.]|uniref:hypothetical protein n=1 Tax=Candidatus Caldatribacterium sp. TaxID=2282143 RepID=UPI00384292B1|nr:hypothetical protein [Candidatus Caldatribacterium sp.]